jgi:hypothetical protein
MHRNEALQAFVDAAFVAFDRFATDVRSRGSIMRIFSLLETPAGQRAEPGRRLAVCSRFLDEAMAVETGEPPLRALLESFRSIEPSLEWVTKPVYDASASQNFPTSHANAMIAGPKGLEDRSDVWLGVTLMAPHVRYPNHDHPPEETYLVLSEGEFMQADNNWFTPGIGGSFYNPPGIRHAMRSGGRPLLALWALLADQPRATGDQKLLRS